jgi:hypothetical protein
MKTKNVVIFFIFLFQINYANDTLKTAKILVPTGSGDSLVINNKEQSTSALQNLLIIKEVFLLWGSFWKDKFPPIIWFRDISRYVFQISVEIVLLFVEFLVHSIL